MALCGYCGKVEVAWHQEDRRWVACAAKRDAAGEVLRVAVRSGTRTVMRPVPDPSQRHYPHAGAVPVGSECLKWTREAAEARPRKRRGGWRPAPAGPADVCPECFVPGPAHRAGCSRISAGRAVGSTIPAAAPIPTATVGATAAAAPAKPAKRARSMEPEELMDPADLAAWARAEAAIRCELLPTRVMLWGRPGTGKTELPWRIARELGWQHVYQLMTEETPATELLGHLIVQGGSTVWCDGTLGRAILASHEGPVVYVADEIGRASQDAMSACLLAMTNPESLRLTLRSGEVIAPNPANWHVVATSNDDPAMLNPALADRLHIAVRVNAPHPGLVRSMATVEARRLATSRAGEYSIRALLTYDRLRQGGMSFEDAAGMVWEPAVAQSFMDAARLEGGIL